MTYMDYSVTQAERQPRFSSHDREQDRDHETERSAGRTSWPIGAIAMMQSILWLGHWLIFATWTSFVPTGANASRILAAALFLLSISFTVSSILSFRYANAFVAGLYTVAAVWTGILNFLTWAALLIWVVDVPFRIAGANTDTVRLALGLSIFGAAVLVSLAGFVNARVLRVRRHTVELPNLPESWRGRTALLISDIHLGHVNATRFARRVARLAARLNPAAVFIAGDLYDGSKVRADRIAGPLFEMKPPLGVYFCGGNHEEYGDPVGYEKALRKGGIRVLHNERADVDGLQVIGVSYFTSSHPLQLRAFLNRLRVAEGGPSILLNHVPHGLPIVEQAGVDLQLSGHTHGGQTIPFTWLTKRMFKQFTYGLQRMGNLQVLVSSGVGTWGPPMRVGTAPEVVLITFA